MRLLLTELKIRVVGFLGALLLTLIAASLRWRKVVLQVEPPQAEAHQPRLFVLWHNRQLLAPYAYNHILPKEWRSQLHALVSEHRDGRYVAIALAFNGMKDIPGSSSNSGRRALLGLIRVLREGNTVAVTPDGPRGPIYKLKPGVLKLAQISGLPIYYFTYGVKSSWVFNSWDKTFLPKPFSPAVAVCSGPFRVPENASSEDLKRLALEVERELTRVTEIADNYEYA